MTNDAKAQQKVIKAVEARGYREGWDDAQFLARQFAKMTEELSKAYDLIHTETGVDFRESLNIVGFLGWLDFDIGPWRGVRCINLDKLAGELADMQVVLFCMAAVGWLRGEEFDVVQAAVEKATADVERGVR